MAKPKLNELSSREDFLIEQFAYMKKLNKMAAKLFDLYYIDVDRNSELSPMMRNMVPPYYVDPTNPEHPGCYILAGKSSVPYLERMVFVTPFVNEKGKYENDISAWKGTIIKPLEFNEKSKEFRKTKLEPMVIMGERNGDLITQSIIVRESNTPAKQELVLPFLMLPNRKRDGEDVYQRALQASIYDALYQYLIHYVYRAERFVAVPPEAIDAILDKGVADLYTEDGDIVTVTKNVFPCIERGQRFSIAKIRDPMIDTSGGRFHYMVAQEALTPLGQPAICIYTLMSALQMNERFATTIALPEDDHDDNVIDDASTLEEEEESDDSSEE